METPRHDLMVDATDEPGGPSLQFDGVLIAAAPAMRASRRCPQDVGARRCGDLQIQPSKPASEHGDATQGLASCGRCGEPSDPRGRRSRADQPSRHTADDPRREVLDPREGRRRCRSRRAGDRRRSRRPTSRPRSEPRTFWFGDNTRGDGGASPGSTLLLTSPMAEAATIAAGGVSSVRHLITPGQPNRSGGP